VQVEGITLEVVAEALQQAKQGRQHILGEMAKCQPPPRNELGQYTPRILRVAVDSNKVGMVIGAGGKVIRAIRDESGCSSIQVLLPFMCQIDQVSVANCVETCLKL